MILIFSMGFVNFVHERGKIYSVKEKSEKMGSISEKYLLHMENKNSERIKLKGIDVNGKREYLNEQGEYYSSRFTVLPTGKTELKRLLFFPDGSESVGQFKINEIKDKDGNFYSPPIEENKVYKELEVTYKKNVLNVEISYREKLTFKRKDALTVTIEGGGENGY